MSENPVAVVTGASSGIGYAVARRLHGDGYRVVGVSAHGAYPESGWRPEYTPIADVADQADVDALVDEVLDEAGQVDVLVTCAGVLDPAPLPDISPDRVQRQVAVNLLGTIAVCRGFSDALVRSRGSVVTVSSSIVTGPQPNVAAYAASKGGVEAFTRVLALELAPHGVRVNAVRPSLVESRIWIRGGMDPDDYRALLDRRAAEYPLGRVGRPKDVAAAVSFLVSEEASWITGVVLPVDGGSGLVGR